MRYSGLLKTGEVKKCASSGVLTWRKKVEEETNFRLGSEFIDLEI